MERTTSCPTSPEKDTQEDGYNSDKKVWKNTVEHRDMEQGNDKKIT